MLSRNYFIQIERYDTITGVQHTFNGYLIYGHPSRREYRLLIFQDLAILTSIVLRVSKRSNPNSFVKL